MREKEMCRERGGSAEGGRSGMKFNRQVFMEPRASRVDSFNLSTCLLLLGLKTIISSHKPDHCTIASSRSSDI